MILSIVSQVLQALSSFLTTLIFVAILSPGDFGTFAAFTAVWTIAASANRTIYGEQLIARNLDDKGYRAFTFLWGIGGILISAAVSSLFGTLELIIAAAYAAAFAAGDAFRYERLASIRGMMGNRLLIFADALRALLLLAAYVMATMDQTDALVILVTALSALVWPATVVRHPRKLNPALARMFLRRGGRFEATMAAQFIIGTGASQALPFLALGAFGTQAYGTLRLTQSLVGPAGLIATSLAPLVISSVASMSTFASQVRRMLSLAAIAFVAALITWVLVTFAVSAFAPVMVPRAYVADVQALVPPCAAAAVLVMVGLPGGALIRARRYARVALVGQLAGVGVGYLAAILALSTDIVTFAWFTLGGSSCTVVITYALLLAQTGRDKNQEP